MNDNFEIYLDSLKRKYSDELEVSYSDDSSIERLENVPNVLRPLYSVISSAKLPFGQIFSIDEALKHSQRLPFIPDWFVFGKDKYFSYWICLYNEDDDGLSFTYWDHTSGNILEGAVWGDVVEFLQEVEADG
jgi:hypothetical protein